jgi:peptide/nickel transport system substrate-binding protein/oligopeptide transport system substrate-binding protein
MRQTKQRFFVVACSLFFALAAQAETTPKPPLYALPRPPASDRTALTVVMSGGPVQFDPRASFLASEAQVFTGVYEGLFSYHPFTMEPVPAAASDWKLSDDKKTWTFHLRDDLKYSDGTPIKAGDFRAAWLSLLEPSRNSPYSSLFDLIEGARDFRTGKTTDPSTVGVSCPDDKTLVVRLVTPASFFPAMLCHHCFGPLSPAMLKDGAFEKGIVGNGPFVVEKNTPDQIIMVKNKNYWDADNVKLQKITLILTDDIDQAADYWNTGVSRWIAGGVNFDKLTDRSGIVVNPMFATHYYYVRCDKKPWNDERLRQALVLSLPWDTLRKDFAMPAKTLIYPLQGYPNIKTLETTDVDKAKKLLVDAGFANGKNLPTLILQLSGTGSEDANETGIAMAKAWKAIGIPVKISFVPIGQYLDSLKAGTYTVANSTWIGDFADPYTFLQMWRGDSNLNDAHFHDAEFEKLLDKSMGEEEEARYKTMSEAEERLLQSAACIPMAYSPAVNVIDTNDLGGWFPNALDIHPFKYLYYKEAKPLPSVALAR